MGGRFDQPMTVAVSATGRTAGRRGGRPSGVGPLVWLPPPRCSCRRRVWCRASSGPLAHDFTQWVNVGARFGGVLRLCKDAEWVQGPFPCPIGHGTARLVPAIGASGPANQAGVLSRSSLVKNRRAGSSHADPRVRRGRARRQRLLEAAPAATTSYSQALAALTLQPDRSALHEHAHEPTLGWQWRPSARSPITHCLGATEDTQPGAASRHGSQLARGPASPRPPFRGVVAAERPPVAALVVRRLMPAVAARYRVAVAASYPAAVAASYPAAAEPLVSGRVSPPS